MDINKIDRILNKGEKLKIPDKLEKRNLAMIDRLSQISSFNENKSILMLLFKPAYAVPVIAVFIITPLIILFIKPMINRGNSSNYRAVNEEKMKSIIIENQIKGLKESVKAGEVRNAGLTWQNKNIIINWENPTDPLFKEVVIERYYKKEKLNIYKGNDSSYIDLNAGKATLYYSIKVITMGGGISPGVKVYLK